MFTWLRIDEKSVCKVRLALEDEKAREVVSLLSDHSPAQGWECVELEPLVSVEVIPDFCFLVPSGHLVVTQRVAENARLMAGMRGVGLLPVTVCGSDGFILCPPILEEALDLEMILKESGLEGIDEPAIRDDFNASADLFSVPDCEGYVGPFRKDSFIEILLPLVVSGQLSDRGLIFNGLTTGELRDELREWDLENGDEEEEEPQEEKQLAYLDLRVEAARLKGEFVEIFSRFTNDHREQPVVAIEIQYDTDPGGYNISIDTRERYEEGTWNRMKFSDYAFGIADDWMALDRTISERKVELVTASGDRLALTMSHDGHPVAEGAAVQTYLPPHEDSNHLTVALGIMLTEVMRDLVGKGCFRDWNLRPDAKFHVFEIHDGWSSIHHGEPEHDRLNVSEGSQ